MRSERREDEMVGLSPVGHWHMNEVAVGAGSVIDSGTGGNDGTPTNMENADCDQVNQKLGAACLTFDGSNEYVDFGDNLDFEYDEPFSIEGWFWFSDMDPPGANDFGLVGKFDTVNDIGYFVAWRNTIQFRLQNDANYIDVQGTTIISSETHSHNTWYHIGVTYNGSGSTSGMNIYFNGVKENVTVTSGGDITGSTTLHAVSFKIGIANSLYHAGKIDEIAVYDVELSEEDMKARYSWGVGTESMDTITWDVSALTNIYMFKVFTMTLDEGLSYAKIQVQDNVLPADWYISFTYPNRFSASTDDEQSFKGIVDKTKTRRDDESGIVTFHLDHWLNAELKAMIPASTIGEAADTYEDIMEDDISANCSNIVDGGHISGSTTTDAMTFKGRTSRLALYRKAAEADKHVVYIEQSTSEIWKETPTRTNTLTWDDTICRWMGSEPTGARPNRVYATGVGLIADTPNGYVDATDTTYQTKYGVIPVYRTTAFTDQDQLDNWAQGYIDNLAAGRNTIYLQLYTGYQVAVGQTITYSSSQMNVASDTYLVKSVRYNVLSGEVEKVKISLGVNFKAQVSDREEIEEVAEIAAVNTTDIATNTGDVATNTTAIAALSRDLVFSHLSKDDAQTIGSASATRILWRTGTDGNDEEDSDTLSFHVTNPGSDNERARITVPVGYAGIYQIIATSRWDSNTTGRRAIIISKNGTNIAECDNDAGSAGNSSCFISYVVSLAEADYIEIKVYQNSGANRTILGERSQTFVQLFQIALTIKT